MNLPELISFYKKRCDHFTTSLIAERKKINLVSNLRLITALCFLITAYFAFTNHNPRLRGLAFAGGVRPTCSATQQDV